VTAYGYDAVGRQRTQTIFDGVTPLTMQLDANGRATAIGEGVGGTDPYTTTFGFNASGSTTAITMPGGVNETAGYDGDTRVTSVGATGPNTGSPATTLNSAYMYGYNASGWTTSTTTLSGTDTIAHDALRRVTVETGPQVVAAGGTYRWTYDGNGNLLTQIGDDGKPVTYTYSQGIPNEVQTMVMGNGQPTTSYSYNNNGDTTGIVDGAKINTHVLYDAAARPIQVAFLDRSTPATVTLSYNADGRRSHYTLTEANQPTLDEQFQYRDDQLGQLTVISGGVTLYVDTYIYNQDGTPLEFLRTQSGATNRYWYVLDGRDNVVAVTDVTGKVVDRYAYDSWGELTSDDATNETVPQQLRYAGYWYDEKLSRYWASARYYDPEIERWLQPDPSASEGLRTYAYVADDPIDAADPTGLNPDYQHLNDPRQWLACPTGATLIQNKYCKAAESDALNVVVSANSDFSGGGQLLSLIGLGQFLGGTWFPWKQVPVSTGGPISALQCAVSKYSADVGGTQPGRRPQESGFRRGGCSQYAAPGYTGPPFNFTPGIPNNHAREWPQGQQGGGTADFIAASEEQECFTIINPCPGGLLWWHKINSPDGFTNGRNDFVTDVIGTQLFFHSCFGLFLSGCGWQHLYMVDPKGVPLVHAYHPTVGSNGALIDGQIAVIKVKRAF